MHSAEQLREIYRRLAEPFPEEAIERTKASVTRRGYDTTGVKYQYIVNRLNEVLGVGGFRVERDFSVREKQTRKGYDMIEATCDLVMQLGQWVDGAFVPFAEATGTGGHTSAIEADARKGAFTNGFKKTAAFFGCGWRAYAGVIDDDNVTDGDNSGSPPVAGDDYQPRGSRSQATTRSSSQGRTTSSGRVTKAQLTKMRELVTDIGGSWPDYRAHVREKHGINVEYADRKTASNLINGLIASARKARGNGSDARST